MEGKNAVPKSVLVMLKGRESWLVALLAKTTLLFSREAQLIVPPIIYRIDSKLDSRNTWAVLDSKLTHCPATSRNLYLGEESFRVKFYSSIAE